MDSRLSPALMEDLSLLTENGIRQSLDNQTVCETPCPLAASTVVRNNLKQRDLSLADPRGSFINTIPSRNQSPYELDLLKLTFNKSSDSSESRSDVMGCNDVSARSSLGLIPAEAMNDDNLMFGDVSSSTLLLNNSKMKPITESRHNLSNQQSSVSSRYTPSSQQPSLNGQSATDSNDWLESSSKHDSKNHAIGSSHIVDTVKKRPDRDSAIGTKNNQAGAVMSLFGGGLLGDVSEGCEMDASVHDVQFEADELQLLDEDFSDLEEIASTDDEEVERFEFKVEKRTLTDDDKLQGNVKDNGCHDDESVEDRQSAVGEENWHLDQKYFRVSPAVYSNTGERRRVDNISSHSGHMVDPSSNLLSDIRKRFCDGEGSDVDQFSPSGKQIFTKDQSNIQRPGLIGESNPKDDIERQSGEGEVSHSPDYTGIVSGVAGYTGVVGGVGLGDGSSGPDSDDANPRQPTSKTTPHKFAQPPLTCQLDLFPGEERIRPMGNDLLTERQMIDQFQPTLPSFISDDSFQTRDDAESNDWLLQSKYIAVTNESKMMYQPSVGQLDNSSFRLEDYFKGENVENENRFEKDKRMGAFGYNAADFPQGDDPFSNFNSSFGSFGLKQTAVMDDSIGETTSQNTSTNQHVERRAANLGISSNPTSSVQNKELREGKNSVQQIRSSNEKRRSDNERESVNKASTGAGGFRQSADLSTSSKSERQSRNQSYGSGSKFHTSMSASTLDNSNKTDFSRRSNSAHRSESLANLKHESETPEQNTKCFTENPNVKGQVSRRSSCRSSKPHVDTPTPRLSSTQQKRKDALTKMPKPIASIGQPKKSVNRIPALPSVAKYNIAKTQKTNLAFHTYFNEEAAKQIELFDSPELQINEEDFVSGDVGLKMFDEDEKEFNNENMFSEHDNMIGCGGTTFDAYRSVMSQSVCTLSDDPWDNRLSVGEYWAQGTENLGTLEGNPDLPRPEFGMKIKTPPSDRKPLPLFKTACQPSFSDVENQTQYNTKDTSSVVSDLTFTMSDLNTLPHHQMVKRTVANAESDTVAIENPKDLSALTQSLLNLEQSLSDESGLLSVSAISSFISKISKQSDATELVNTIMTLSKMKSQAKRAEKTETLVQALQKGETSKPESSTSEEPRSEKTLERRSKLPVRRGSNKELLEKTQKSIIDKETPSPPVAKPTPSQFRNAQISSSAKNITKKTPDNLVDSCTDDDWNKYNSPNRETDYFDNQNSASPINNSSTGQAEWRSPRPSMGGRHCISSDSQLRCQVLLPIDGSNPTNRQKFSEGTQIKADRRSYELELSCKNVEPPDETRFSGRHSDESLHVTQTNNQSDLPKATKSRQLDQLQSSLFNNHTSSTKRNDSPIEVRLEDSRKSGEPRISFESTNRTSCSRRSTNEKQVYKPTNQKPDNSNQMLDYVPQPSNEFAQNRYVNKSVYEPLEIDKTVSQFDASFSSTNRTKDFPGTSSNTDNKRSSEHHIPDGCDYSSRSNYFSSDKELSRDLVVGTDDIRMSDCRGFSSLPSKTSDNNWYQGHDYSPHVPEINIQSPSVPIQSFHHDLLPRQQPDKPTLLTNKSLLGTEFAQNYLKKNADQKDGEFKVPYPVKDSVTHDNKHESFCSEDTSFYELQAQNLSRLSHVMSEPVPSFYSHPPSSQSTPFKHDGTYSTLPSMTPSYMKSVLSTGPINSRYIETDISYLDNSGLPMATPKQLTSLEVPSVFSFPETSCVGISLSANLPITNPTSRWQECILHINELSINNHTVNPDKYSPFELKKKVIIEPNSTENISVLFVPRIPGAFVAQLFIYAKPFLKDVFFTPSRIPVEVTIQAIAENTNIQVITKEEGQVNFGQLTWGACRTSSIQLRNLNKASIPVKLKIAATNAAWQCFSFDKDISANGMNKGSRPVSPVFGKDAMSLCLEGYGERSSNVEDIKIYCRPPYKQLHKALSQCPVEIFEARIDVEIDSNIPNINPLSSILLKAEVGMAKLHTARDLEKIHLSCYIGKNDSQSCKLKNAGNIGMELSIFVRQFGDIFKVSPKFLHIPAGEERNINVAFNPKDKAICKYDSLLLLEIEPDGPTYEIPLRGDVQKEITPPTGPFLLSDKHSLPFGGVAIGRTKQLRVVLKSNAQQALKLRIEIRSASDAFQFQMTSTGVSNKDQGQHKELIIQPQEKFPIYVVYSPTQVESNVGKLVIKPYDCHAKFCLSLLGYGGVSNVTLNDVNQSGSSRFWVDVGEVIAGKSGMHKISISNTGQRPAFVKAVPFTDLQLKQTLPPGRIAVDPNEFILAPRQSTCVHIAFCPSDREVAVCYRDKEVAATVAFYHGDEVSRQKYRRAINKPNIKPGKKNHKLPENVTLQKVNFDVSYSGDKDDKVLLEDKNIGDTTSDIDLFYSNLAHLSLALIGHPAVKINTCTPQVHTKTIRYSSESNSDYYNTLPVISNNRKSNPSDGHLGFTSYHPGEKDCDWSVLPQQLVCNVYREGKKSQTGHFQIVNFSIKDIKFELSWPGHWFSVNPECGLVKAKSNKMIAVSPSSNLQASSLPWSGAVVVCCNDQFEEVKVQLRSEVSTVDSAPSNMVALTTQLSESLNKSKEVEKYLQLPLTHFSFPKTLVADHSGKALEFTNTSSDTLSWSINSFAPAYAKGIDKTSDVYRVTYSVFVVKEKTGQLLPNQTAKVQLMFVPRSEGTFTQYWDLQCYIHPSITENSMTVKISLVGEAGRQTETSEDSISSTSESSECDMDDRPVIVKEEMVHFRCVEGVKGTALKIEFQNKSDQSHTIKVIPPKFPFYIKHHSFNIGKKKFLKYPIEFKTETAGIYKGLIIFKTDLGYSLSVNLHGESWKE